MKPTSLQILDSVSSTMDVARENILTGRVHFKPLSRPEVGGVLAREQTAGRGQRGRTWYAEPGAGLHVTYYFRRGLTDPQHAGEIALLAGVAVVEALHPQGLKPLSGPQNPPSRVDLSPLPELGEGPGMRAAPFLGLKWPNDVLLKGKKVGGILIEMVNAPDGEWVALVGVGINLSVREFPPELAGSATSFLREGFEPPEVEACAERVLASLHRQADLRDARGFGEILHRWRDYDATAGRQYETEVEGKTVSGVAEGVDEKGALLLRTAEGRALAVTSATSLREIE